MSTQKSSELPTLSRLERWTSVVIGVLVFAIAGLLYFHPPHRVSVTQSVTSALDSRKTSQSTSDSEPAVVVIAILTAGLVLLAYGLNGIRMTKLSSSVIGFETSQLTVTVPEEAQDLPQTPKAQASRSPPQPTIDALYTFEVLVTPRIAREFRPTTMPASPFLPSPRELRPGQQITFDPLGLRNATDLFYFSHDIMLCFTALLCGAPLKMVFYTASQAKNHLAQIGFSGTALIGQLEQIMNECDPKDATEMEASRRYEIAAEIFRLSRFVGRIVKQGDQALKAQQ